MNKVDIKAFSESELRDYFKSIGQKAFRADQVAHWLFNRDADEFDQMDNLPVALRQELSENCKLTLLEESECSQSNDGTVKWLYKTWDGYFVETVLIPNDERNSVCVSTQVGCAMGCHFCRTSKMGLKRHLTTGEILEQFINTRRFCRGARGQELTNIIYMGMGEPFHNFDNVVKSIGWLHHEKYFNLSRKRITVSTSGVIPKIREMAEIGLPANLALSLNGTNDEMRTSIMPITTRYPMDQLLEAVDFYLEKTGNPVTFEYVLIKNITCTPQAARELVQIIKNRNCKVNAIVLNASDDPNLIAPTEAEVQLFLDVLRTKTDKVVTLRQPRGRDIKAACGQLAYHKEKVA
jgi:23S rRNA (adenine2503-C2)-methyltransferase